jgi:transposase
MHISPGGAKLKTHLLGPHPIVRHFIERLNLHAIVRSAVGSGREPVIDHGEALAALVHNILESPAPLYRIAAWAEPIAPQAFAFTPDQKASLNDDRIARMLDALVSERGRGIWFRLALRIIKQFKIATARMHHDTTTVTFHGQYRGSVLQPRIAHGHNKDHRPDLKQLVFGLTVSADGAVPVHHQVLSGNRTDDTVHRANLEDLRQILGRSDFVYVADGKLASSTNLREIARHHGKFVTVIPRTRTEDKKFRQRLREEGVRWKRIWAIPNKRRENEPPDVFYSCSEGPERSSDGFRIIWVRSSAKAEHDEALRLKRLDQARAELLLLSPRLNRRRLRSRRQIRQAVREIIRRAEMEPFLTVKLHRQMREEVRRLKRGRPKASDPVRVVRKPVWSFKVKVDDAALRAERRVDGVFPLGTNLDKASKRQVLEIYKYQPYVEKRFSQLKTDLEVAPVYLKKSLRCAGLVHAYYVALAVAALIERAVRQGMVREKIEDLPLFPEGRPTATPTCPRILEAFRSVSWHEFRRGEDVVRFPIELSQLQKLLLKLLEVPRELYA